MSKGRLGPGAVIAAAFVGPGTVTTCTLAGAKAGTQLLWAVLFSVIATLVLQEMTLRLGLVGRMALAEAIRRRFATGSGRWISMSLVLGAIVLGCAAYEAGNLLGAELGLEAIFPGLGRARALLVLIPAFFLLAFGGYGPVEKILVLLVCVMSLAFAATAFAVSPPLAEIGSGIFVPTLPSGSEAQVLALIGTTVVPYNLFLHSVAVQRKFTGGAKDLGAARFDATVFIFLGGVVSAAILITAAGNLAGPGDVSIKNGADLAEALEGALGSWAKWLFGLGLFAAGLSSAVTAPLAAGFAVSGLFSGDGKKKDRLSRGASLLVFLTGAVFLLLDVTPVQAIILAQAFNGLALPMVAVFLLVVMNDASLLGARRNSLSVNLLGGAVTLITVFLGGRWFYLAMEKALGSS